jgi:hypothetical protein
MGVFSEIEIEQTFVKNGFKLLNPTATPGAHCLDFYSVTNEQYVYYYRQDHRFIRIVVHPEADISALLTLNGVSCSQEARYGTDLKAFPKRLRRGKKPIQYGLPVDIESLEALDDFLRHFSRHFHQIDSGYMPADDVDPEEVYREGAVRQVIVNAYERNSQARAQCIAHYGPRCSICGFDFEKVYGAVGAGYIHVHHLRQLADIGEQYKVNPISDLRPVCANCHAIIHLRTPPYSIDEVIEMRKKQSV